MTKYSFIVWIVQRVHNKIFNNKLSKFFVVRTLLACGYAIDTIDPPSAQSITMQIKKTGIIFFALSLLFSPSISAAQSPAQCEALARNLRLGMTGSDVIILQKELNKNTKTQVASSGPGSRGQETSYFGGMTMSAVIKFQGLYASEVLKPVGLSVGTGFVGASTRAKITSLCRSGVATISPPPPVSPATNIVVPVPANISNIPVVATSGGTVVISNELASPSAFKSDTPVLMFPSTYAAPRGTKVMLYGVGLAPTGNTVRLGSLGIASTSVDKWNVLTFVVPEDAPRGKHELYISSQKGSTNKSFFIVTDKNIPKPTIISLSPTEGLLGTVVTVTGTGFVSQGNEVMGGQGFQKNIASPDGKTLQFTVTASVPGIAPGIDYPEVEGRIPVWFGVVNENGLTEKLLFTVTI